MKRFFIAQDTLTISGKSILEQSINEIKNGNLKCHCYIRYLFPQLKGLGKSSVTEFYAIKNREEAYAYMNNEELRNRYLKCCQALIDSQKSIYEIFGHNTMRIRASLLLMNSVYNNNLIKSLLKNHCWL
ncbi:MAG: DUF1810 family protein [Prevotellamassilia sp.]|nr:DUF1810 family protein [Prevotellamassilia sp.]